MTAELPSTCPLQVQSKHASALSIEINVATRKQHTELNRLILDRLPLALPPCSPDPSLFGHGLIVFARIYYAFEAVWANLLSSPGCTTQNAGRDAHVRKLLADLRPAGLVRTTRLRNDIQYITGITRNDLESTLAAQQREMLDAITQSVLLRPHLLLAYGWVMYMAIFSGGRYIRQQLANAGSGFWIGEEDLQRAEKSSIDALEMPGFSFLSFDSELDGEDIKATFAARFVEVAVLLSNRERLEVVKAAQDLFQDCIGLVGMLDRENQAYERRERQIWKILFGVAIFALLFFAYVKYQYMQ